MCVFFPFILDIKFVGRTSRGHTRGRSHRFSHPPSFCGTCLNFSREKDSAISFPRRPWSRILCTNDLIVLHPLGIFSFSFLVRKIPFAGIELMSQRVRGYMDTSELPGRPAVVVYIYSQHCEWYCAWKKNTVNLPAILAEKGIDKISWARRHLYRLGKGSSCAVNHLPVLNGRMYW